MKKSTNLIVLFILAFQLNTNGQNLFRPIDTVQAQKLLIQVDSLIKIKKYKQGIDNAILAQQIYNCILGPFNEKSLNTYIELAKCYLSIGQPADAKRVLFEKYNKSLYQFDPESHKITKSIFGIGAYYHFEKSLDSALVYYQKALNRYQKLPPTDSTYLLKTLERIASIHSNTSRLDSSIYYHTLSINIIDSLWGEMSFKKSYATKSIGINYHNMGKYMEAIPYYKETLSLHSYAVHNFLAGEDSIKIKSFKSSIMNNNIASCQESFQAYDKALTYYKKGLWHANPQIENDTSQIIFALNGIGSIFRKKGEYDSSLYYLQQCDSFFLNSNSLDLNRKIYNLEVRGIIYENMGDLQSSLQAYQEVLEIRKMMLGDRNPDLAYSYLNFGSLYHKLGDYDKALFYLESALAFSQANGDKYAHLIPLCYRSMGNSFYQKDKFEDAILQYEKALEIYNTQPSRYQLDISDTYLGLGNTYGEMWQKQKAISYHKKSFEICKRELGIDHNATPQPLTNIGVSYMFLQQYDLALQYFEQAKEILEKSGKEITANHEINFAVVYMHLEKFAKADSFYKKGLEKLNYDTAKPFELDNVSRLQDLLLYFSIIIENQTKWLIASKSPEQINSLNNWVDQALHALKYQKQNLSDISNRSLAVEGHILYDKIIHGYYTIFSLTHDQNHFSRIFSFIEDSKELALRSYFRDYQSMQYAGVPEDLIQYEHSLKSKIAYLQRKIHDLQAKGIFENDSTMFFNQVSLVKNTQSLDSLKQAFAKSFPKYYDLKYDDQLTLIPEVQSRLEENQAFLEYFVADSSIFIQVIT